MDRNACVRFSVAYPIMFTVLRIYPPLIEEEASEREPVAGEAVVDPSSIDASTLSSLPPEPQTPPVG